MDYTIVTYGGGETLIDVFNAIGRIFSNDSTYLTPVGKLGMTLGCLWAGARAIYKADIATFFSSWMLPSFLAFMLLFSPKASVWIRDEVSLNAPVKVDNIPFGIAFFSSIPSMISYSLAIMIEEHLLPVESGLYAGKNGVMFGAKAAGRIRDIQIEDPTTLHNTKEFMRQCYMKPYIMGNFGGHKSMAARTGDILEFLRANPVQNFGIYYKDPSNRKVEFKTCAQMTPLITEAINRELNGNILSKFASAIGLEGRNKEILKLRLKAMTGSTMRYLDSGTTDINKWMQQAMILNANRESYDDWREKFNLQRIHPNLIAMQATRGMFQQSMGYLVAGEMAATNMPALQTALMALIVCLILVVVPMSLLAGGLVILKTWIMLLIWINSWPLFFSLINCLGMIAIKSAVASSPTSGNILSLIGQGWFSETLLNKYANYQLLLTTVPILSWAVLKGCAHGMSSLAGQFTPAGIGSSIGSQMAEGNLSMNNISYGNRTQNQENYTPSLQFGGGIIDDGNLRVQTDSTGNQFVTEQSDSLQTNYRASEQYSSSIGTQLSDAGSYLSSLSQRSSDLTTTTDNQTMDMAQRISDGTATINGMSTSEMKSMRDTLSSSTNTNEVYSEAEKKDTSTTTGLGVGANVNAGLQVGSAKPLSGIGGQSDGQSEIKKQPARPISAGIGISGSGNTGVSATNNDTIAHDSSAVSSMSRQDALERVKSAVKNDTISSTSDDVKTLSKSLNRNLSELDQVGNDMAKTQQQVVSLTEQRGYLEQNSGSIDRNVNDRVLQEFIKSNPTIKSKEQAVRWMQNNPTKADNIARNIIATNNPFGKNSLSNAGQTQQLIASSRTAGNNASNVTIASKEDIRANHSNKPAMEKPIIEGSESRAQAIPQNVDKAMDSTLIDSERYVAKELHNLPNEINDKKDGLKQKFKDTSRSTAGRAAAKIGENIMDAIKPNKGNKK